MMIPLQLERFGTFLQQQHFSVEMGSEISIIFVKSFPVFRKSFFLHTFKKKKRFPEEQKLYSPVEEGAPPRFCRIPFLSGERERERTLSKGTNRQKDFNIEQATSGPDTPPHPTPASSRAPHRHATQ